MDSAIPWKPSPWPSSEPAFDDVFSMIKKEFPFDPSCNGNPILGILPYVKSLKDNPNWEPMSFSKNFAKTTSPEGDQFILINTFLGRLVIRKQHDIGEVKKNFIIYADEDLEGSACLSQIVRFLTKGL